MNQPGYAVDPRTDLFTVGLTTEVIFHNQNNTAVEHGIRGFLGTTFGNNDRDYAYDANKTFSDKLFRSVFPKASYFIRIKKYFGVFEVGENIFFARVGLRF